MRVGVYTRDDDPLSIAGYRRHVVAGLTELGVQCTPVTATSSPDCDILWDPGLGMRRVPEVLCTSEAAVVATVHGLRAFTLPARESADSWWGRLRDAVLRLRVAHAWRRLLPRVRAVIAVSRYGADEAHRALGVPADLLHPIYHGVAHDTFYPDPGAAARSHFLVVAQYQAKKNIDRVLAAYAGLPDDRPPLLAIIPGFPKSRRVPAGVTVERQVVDHATLARRYREALAYVFPSLHETFGMPLLEAMACGCPVITSHDTACAEVTGGAALLVDPRSVDDIRAAMNRIASDRAEAERLRARGLERVAQFSWQSSAEQHLAVFEAALKGAP